MIGVEFLDDYFEYFEFLSVQVLSGNFYLFFNNWVCYYL